MIRQATSAATLAAMVCALLLAGACGNTDRFGTDLSPSGKYLNGEICVVTADGCTELLADGKALPGSYEQKFDRPSADAEKLEIALAQKLGDETTELGTLAIPWMVGGKAVSSLTLEISVTPNGRISAVAKVAGGKSATHEIEKFAAIRETKEGS